MLIRMGGRQDSQSRGVRIAEAAFPSPFKGGLEYSCAARGTWNIVHTGFLVPQCHEIFVCAAGCLRGVVLTAAEMGRSENFSTIEIRENDVLDGGMEQMITEGVTDILNGLNYKPRAVLVYTSCIHHFMGCDIQMCYDILRRRFPDTDFTDCYMDPIMRKSGLTPDQTMRRQIYSLIKPREKDVKRINIIGSNLPADKESELYLTARSAGYELTVIQDCKSYDDYQKMGEASANIYYDTTAAAAAAELEKRLSQKALFLPLSYSYDEISKQLDKLCGYVGAEPYDCSEGISKCEEALSETAKLLDGAPVEIDYTAVLRPFSLARLLLTHGINVTALYCDSISGIEQGDFEFLKSNYPDIYLYPTMDVSMRDIERKRNVKTLAIGQKAAYFSGSGYFVNIIESGGFYGFTGIQKLCGLIRDAWLNEKDMLSLIQIKGMGCGCV